MKRMAIILFAAFASCSIYESKFECPPGEGIGCKPVSEVLDMVVERENGEDLFVKDGRVRAQWKRKAHKNGSTQERLHLLKEQDGDPVIVRDGR